jgi:hypothetical protein
LHHFGREEFGGRKDIVSFQKSSVRYEPSTKGIRANASGSGKFDFGVGLHKNFEL